ncbi:MAG TPA: MotA/TolQ/ExbB proton channel family protein [Fibrobacteria bacterium]|jgi:biopolymer transport protein ExbB|nr:MotA/TolQ/ExbB proton channel family protein [Fibrobacteria bacterium]
MNTLSCITSRALLAASLSFAALAAAKDEPRGIEALRREAAGLESLRADKLETLERREAARWDARYKAVAQARDDEERARSLEEAYARLSGEASRLEDEWTKARDAADEKKEALQAAQEGYDGFVAQFRRQADEAAAAVSSDFPVGLEARTLGYSGVSQALTAAKGKEPDVSGALRLFWRTAFSRLDLTRTRSLESRNATFEDGRTVNAWRLRLGTVFVGELEKEGKGSSQILLRTGSLQGKTFAWRESLAGGNNELLRAAVHGAVSGGERALVPFDVLQFRSTGSGYTRGESETAWARFRAWFKAGGITLYPLFAVGFLAIFLMAERLIFFSLRSRGSDRFLRKFREFADRHDWEGAAALAGRSNGSMARVMGAVAANARGTREEAERAVQEAMLREVPAHERRLSLLAATGTASPLLGLLGTVAGLVSLFKMMNQLGASDPKLLSGGISEALINAETGLAIAIPVLLVHGWLQERADALNAALASTALEMLNKIWPRG